MIYYTSYINSPMIKEILNSNYKEKGIEVFTIMRYPSPWFKRYYPNVKNLENLSPFPYLKYSYDKGSMDFDTFAKTYIKQISEDFTKPLTELDKYKDKIVILCCCEKDDGVCHRSALRQLIPNSKELSKEDFNNIMAGDLNE